LNESNSGRLPHLIPIRFGRMMQSPFAFYRGSAAVMAADLASTPVSGIHVQACGDAHLSNFGAFATPERRVIFDINDFDETLPSPWEWDLKRLAVSYVLAGRYVGFPETVSTRAVMATVRSYRERMADYAGMRSLDVWYDAIDIDRFLKGVDSEETRQRVEERLKKVRAKNTPEFLFPKFAQHQGDIPVIADDPPLIFLWMAGERLEKFLDLGGFGLHPGPNPPILNNLPARKKKHGFAAQTRDGAYSSWLS
jgi:hypothetical protein